ncbi:MAG TPA: NAD(P)/FAD-dependent oxidoreductase [Ktedonobacteraceae bacterium]|nr:NAD(P)/FAD-dependent oxidoreductase [Ktedonobacteraceae bacterium]
MHQLSPEPTENAQKHVVILGAGPAGLTATYELMLHGVSATVLEKDPHYVGGIARTVEFHGNRIDIGGHRFFTKNAEIEALWTSILGDELLQRTRLSRVFSRGRYFNYPLEVRDLVAKLGFIEALRCSISYLWAHMHPIKDPLTYEDWVTNEFGRRLFGILLKPYTEKVWGMSTSEISADWAPQRIRRLNVKRLLMSLWPLAESVNGELTWTLVDHFRYPRLGPGQMWERLQAMLETRGQKVFLGREVVGICHNGAQVTHVVVRDERGEIQEIQGTDFISTLPLRDLVNMCHPQLSHEVQEASRALKYRDFLTVALLVNKETVFPDNWVYLPDPGVKMGRIQNFKNWSDAMVVNPKQTCLGLEYFCTSTGDLWSMTDEELVALARRELEALGMCCADEIAGGKVVRQVKAYPVYDEMYHVHVAVIQKYIESRMTNLQLIGRNGMHRYNNQDHAMMTALLAARNIALGSRLDPWKVNTEAQYHEEERLHDDQGDSRHTSG